MALSYVPPAIKKRGPGRPKMTEEEKEIARLQRLAGKVKSYESRRQKRSLYVVKRSDGTVEQIVLHKDNIRYKGKLIYTMKRVEAINALSHLIQVMALLCERHKEELIELIGIKEV
jgi:hypothetical protein